MMGFTNMACRLWRISTARLRAWLFTLMGCNGLEKCLIGPRFRVDYPHQVRIGRRVELEADVWLKLVSDEARLDIGQHSFIGRGTEIDVSKEVVIGDHVLIAPGVFITDHAHNMKAEKLIDSQGCTSTSVSIADDVWLGANSIILPGVSIGRGAVVGAGAVVTGDIPGNSVVAGVPARVLRER